MNILEMTEEEREIQYLSTVWGYLTYHKSKVYIPIVKKLVKEFGNKYDKEIRCLVTNAGRAIRMKATGFVLTRDRNDYIGNGQGISYRRMYSLIEVMKEKEYLSVNLGGVKIKWGEIEAGYTSITRMRDKMLSLFDGVSLKSISTEVGDLLEVRDRETKEYKSTKGFRGVKEMKELIKRYNRKIAESTITIEGNMIATQSYKRVFLDNLDHGGRWYNDCGGVQLLNAEKRSRIEIDGCAVIEYDFSAMHPNILYQLLLKEKCIMTPDGFCPYTIEGLFNSSVPEKSVRNLVKMMVMVGLNASSKGSAVYAVKGKIESDKDKYKGIPEDVNLSKVFTHIVKHNHLIADKFFSDCGVVLQKIDSEIMEHIIRQFLDLDILLLPWHDGFICSEEAITPHEVLLIMTDAWKLALGGVEYCRPDAVDVDLSYLHYTCKTFPFCEYLGYCIDGV